MSESQASSRHCCFRPVTHCIFELDGLLLDSERLYTNAVQKILDPFGHTYSFDLKLRCMGSSTAEAAGLIIDSFQLPISRTQFQRLHKLHSREHLSSVGLMPGVERLLRHLQSCNVPMAIETCGNRELYDLKVRPHSQLFGVFHHAVVGSSDSEVKQCKPAPDIFLLAAARFSEDPPAKPENCLAFEFSLLGMQAALAAGMQVVLVPDPLLSIRLSAPATLRLRSLEAFRPQYFGLPPF